MTKLHHRIGHHVRRLRGQAAFHLRHGFIPHEGNDYHPHVLRKKALHISALTLIGVKVVAIIFVSFYAGQAHLTSISPTKRGKRMG